MLYTSEPLKRSLYGCFQLYHLSGVDFVGASAGALTATLAATNVDHNKALDLALTLAERDGVFKRGSLGGVW